MLQPAGAGFGRGIDIYQLLGRPDRLHQSNKGVMLHLLKLLQQVLNKQLQRAIHESLFTDPPYLGVKLPGDGLTALKATASETRALFMLIIVTLLAAARHEGVLPILESMTGLELGSFVFQVHGHALYSAAIFPLRCEVLIMTIASLQL